jgi:hypothetical protein
VRRRTVRDDDACVPGARARRVGAIGERVVQSASSIDISSMVSVSRARVPSAPVSPARAAAPPVEEANQRLGGDESRARRGTGTGSRDGRVARASRLAGHAPVMSRGMAAEWVCGRPRGADAREGVCRLDGVDKAFFRGNDENVRARGILEEYPIGLLSGSTFASVAASIFTKVETLCLRTFPHKSSSTSRSKRQAANRRFCT